MTYDEARAHRARRQQAQERSRLARIAAAEARHARLLAAVAARAAAQRAAEEDRRIRGSEALLSKAAALRGQMYSDLSESPRDMWGRDRLQMFGMDDWLGILETLGPDYFIDAAMEARRVAAAAAAAAEAAAAAAAASSDDY